MRKTPFLARFPPISQLRAPLEGRKKFQVSSPFGNLLGISLIAYIEKMKKIVGLAQTTLKKVQISLTYGIFSSTFEI